MPSGAAQFASNFTVSAAARTLAEEFTLSSLEAGQRVK